MSVPSSLFASSALSFSLSPTLLSGSEALRQSKILLLHRDGDAEEALRSVSYQSQSAVMRLSQMSDAAQSIDELTWGCLVVDRLEDGDEVAEFIRTTPGFPVVVWAPQLDARTAVDIMKWGVVDVLRKPADNDMLPGAIQRAIRMGREQKAAALFRRDVLQRFAELSGHERSVLSLILQGRTNKQIAAQLDCSLRTLEARRQRILRVMRSENAIEMGVILTQQGLIGDLMDPSRNLRLVDDNS